MIHRQIAPYHIQYNKHPTTGGMFALKIDFTPSYDEVKPKVAFTTIPYHPNIDARSGEPCLDILMSETSWRPGLSLQTVLVMIQALLAHPVIENAVNVEAAEVFLNMPDLYEHIARQCVAASLRVHDGLAPFEDFDQGKADIEAALKRVDVQPYTPTPRQPRKPPVISFDSYFDSWSKLATTQNTVKFRPRQPVQIHAPAPPHVKSASSVVSQTTPRQTFATIPVVQRETSATSAPIPAPESARQSLLFEQMSEPLPTTVDSRPDTVDELDGEADELCDWTKTLPEDSEQAN